MTTATATSPVTDSLQGRARRLRQQAASLTPPLAEAYRRRAAELDLQAWLEAVWNRPFDLRTITDPSLGTPRVAGSAARSEPSQLFPALTRMRWPSHTNGPDGVGIGSSTARHRDVRTSRTAD